jgi:hypothetical protein
VTGTPPLRTTRRRVLRAPAAAVAAGLVATGCDLSGSAGPDDGTSSSTPTPTPDPTATPSADPDEALVAQARSEVADTVAVVVAAGTGRPGLARELAPWERLHRRHLAALPGDDAGVPSARVLGDAPAARRQVLAREARLQTALADAAIGAGSGPLAALLASMSAAVAQRLAVAEAGG